MLRNTIHLTLDTVESTWWLLQAWRGPICYRHDEICRWAYVSGAGGYYFCFDCSMHMSGPQYSLPCTNISDLYALVIMIDMPSMSLHVSNERGTLWCIFGFRRRVELIGARKSALPWYPSDSYQHIDAKTKLTPFCRRHFQMVFLNWSSDILIRIAL